MRLSLAARAGARGRGARPRRAARGWERDAGQERRLVERVEARVGARGDGGGARHVLQERDLAEAVAAPDRPQLAACRGDLELAVGDDVEAVAGLALADDGCPGRRLQLDEPAREPFQRGRSQRREQGQRAQERDLDHRHGRAAVDLQELPLASSTASGSSAPIPTIAHLAPKRPTSAGVSSEPSASPAIERPSSTPKTRESTSPGAVRCRIVRPATSSRLRPAPAAASSSSAPSVVGQAPSSAKAAPQTTTPSTSAGISRRRPTSATVTAIPATPPAPNAAFR